MKIRAITVGDKIPFLSEDKELESVMEERLFKYRRLNEDLIDEFEKKELIVQTKRLCSQPLFSYADQHFYKDNLKTCLQKIGNQFKIIGKLIKRYQIDYFACCAMLADTLEKFGMFEKLLLNEIPVYLQNFEFLFSSVNVASTDNGINMSALKSTAKIIKALSMDPLRNLNFCVSSNILPNLHVPFFPASYHSSDKPGFSLALEMADEVNKICKDAETITEIKQTLRDKFRQIYDTLVPISENIAERFEVEFKGIDFSPAPYPELDKSIGSAIENMGFQYFGSNGCTFGVSLIKDSIPNDLEKILGFSGFMQPVLEDYTIARRLSENKFNLDTLLLYSCLCGTGLDCIPLPGKITVKELFYILLDICVISLKFNKPLTARLMPIPGKNAGDPIEFDFEYFATSKIIDYKPLKDDVMGFYERNNGFIKL